MFLESNRCNDPFLSPHTTTKESLVQLSLPEISFTEGSKKISMADAQRCWDGGKVKEHSGVALNASSPSL